jgi:hypothetical protein
METNDSKWKRRRNVELRDLLSSDSSTGEKPPMGLKENYAPGQPLEKECDNWGPCRSTTRTIQEDIKNP